MKQQIRTDLAVEKFDLAAQSEQNIGRGAEGIREGRRKIRGIRVHTMTVTSQSAANMLCKPIGSYFTVSLDKMLRRYDDGFIDGARCVGELLQELLPKGEKVLIACLGNPNITPDAIGPEAAKHVLVTRHLKQYLPDAFSDFGEVSLICPGVLGTTGVESAAIVKGAVAAVHPDAVIAIDALAARSTDRLCRTIQICDTGIEPGSGVGNRRFALNEDTLGVPVISVGIPTVVDAATLVADMGSGNISNAKRAGEGMMVTPREIDSVVSHSAKLLAYGINFALHPQITLEEMELLIG